METAVEHAKEGVVQLEKAEENQKNALPVIFHSPFYLLAYVLTYLLTQLRCIILLVVLITIMLVILIVKHSPKKKN